MRAALSPAAAQLLRSLLARTGVARDRVRISAFRSVDWHSLTFNGERHEIGLAIPGPDAAATAALLRDGLGEAEWALSGHVVADILIVAERTTPDGEIHLDVEALTLSD